MATVRAVIQDTFTDLSVDTSESVLDRLLVDHDLEEGYEEYTTAHKTAVKKAILSRLQTILAKPDVTEGGFSVRYDRAAIERYCTTLSDELGLTTQPVARNRSGIW